MVITFCVAVVSSSCADDLESSSVLDGHLTLSEILSDSAEISLNGDWAFFPEEFVDQSWVESSSFESLFLSASRRIVPGEFYDDDQLETPSPFGSLVLRLQNDVSEDQELGVELYENATAHRFLVVTTDGEVLFRLEGGVPAKNADDEKTAWLNQSAQFKLLSTHKVVYLIWQISSWHYTWTGPWKSPYIRKASASKKIYLLTIMRDAALLGLFIALIIQHGFLFGFQRGARREHWFLLLLVLLLARHLLFSRWFETLGLGHDGFWFHVRRCTEYALHPLSAVAFARLTYEMTASNYFRPILRTVSYTMLPMVVLPVFLQSDTLGNFVDLFQGAPTIAMVAITYGVWRDGQRGNSTAQFLFWPYLLVIVAIANDIIYAQGLIVSVYMSQYATVGLLAFKSFRLAREHEQARKVSEALSQDLQERVIQRTAELEKATQREIESTKAVLRKNLEMAELGRHLATVGHEIHNPIGTTIALQSQLERDVHGIRMKVVEQFHGVQPISEEHPVMSKLRDVDSGVQVLGIVAQRLQELSVMLRRRSRIESSPSSYVSLNDIVSDTRLLLEGKSQDTEICLDLSSIASIEGNRSHLGVVVSNLVGNALDAVNDFSHGSPTVLISTSQFTSKGRSWVSLTVEDSGHGVPVELRTAIFKEFFTTKADTHGTGLGLTVCREVVSEHSGTLSVGTSDRLLGALFEMRLPCVPGK